nr:Zinc-finger homeodomain protein 2 [Ipomoea batatas]
MVPFVASSSSAMEVIETHNRYNNDVKYMECLKNHAAAMGGTATDGCGEFMPAGEDGSLEALKCSACQCHRNFHRKLLIKEMRKKRFRTKFSGEQKEKMVAFAGRVGWKIQKVDSSVVHNFCQEIGVKRRVLKVWMHNNKNNFAGLAKPTN